MFDPTTDHADDLFAQAEAEAEAGNHTTAAVLFDEAGRAFATAGDDAMALTAQLNRATALMFAGDPAAAGVFAGGAEMAERLGSSARRIDCLHGRAEALLRQEEWDASRTQAIEAIRDAVNYGHDAVVPDLLLLRGRAEYWLDEEAAAIVTLTEASAAFRAQGNIRGKLEADDFAVTVLSYLGKHIEAEGMAQRNVAMARALDMDIAHYLVRLGRTLLAIGRPTAARSEFARAVAMHRAAGRPAMAAAASHEEARAMWQLGDEQEALAVLREAVVVLEAAGPRWLAAYEGALAQSATWLNETGDHYASAAADEQLLHRYVATGEPLGPQLALVLQRCISCLVRCDAAPRAESLLAELEIAVAAGDEATGLQFVAAAAFAWVDAHSGRADRALAAATELLDDPAAEGTGVAAAWVHQICGLAAAADDPAGLVHLARAMALFLANEEAEQAADLADAVLDRA